MTGRLHGDLVRENHLSNESNIRLGARESSASHGLHPIREHEVSAPSLERYFPRGWGISHYNMKRQNGFRSESTRLFRDLINS
jgi:hypothetical protein